MQKKAPAIRFKDFTDAWEQRKVSELLIERNLQAPKSDDYPLMAFVAYEGVSPKGDRYNREFLVTDGVNKKYKRTEFGDFIYSSNNLTTGSIGLNKYGNASISPVYSVFHPTELADADFIGRSFIREDFINKMVRWRQGVIYGQWRIHESDFLEIETSAPSIKEQIMIGKVFDELDNLITLHQRKLSKLKTIKKAMLEKMFPKNGSNVPEIRFAGFTDAWEQRELETIYDKIKNAFVGTASPYYVPQGHFYLESNNVKDGQINRNSEIFINDEFYLRQKDNWLRTGDMVMVQSGHVGHAAVIPPELNNSAAHALIIFSNPKEAVDPYFLNFQYQTGRYRKAIDNITTGNTIQHILSSEMKKFTVMLANLEEQNRISEYFLNIDNLITLHQRKLEKLQNVKKACLEKMFV